MAGIACACELMKRGVGVTLIEASNGLGGRVSSFSDRQTGLLLDNCQHVLLGCCSESIGFFGQLGTLANVEFQDRINVVCGDRRLVLEASRLPAPIHLLPSLARTDYISIPDKLTLFRVLSGLRAKRPGKAESAADYLKALGCSDALMDSLIEPVIVSALNEPASEASACYARMVLMESLARGRLNYRLGVPSVPHSQLVGDAAKRLLENERCSVRLGCRVEAVHLTGGLVRAVRLVSGELIPCEACVAAVPPYSLEKMGINPRGGERLRWLPIVAAHLFFESPTPSFEPVCVAQEPFGWVFSRRADVGYVQVVASAAQGLIGLDRKALLDLALSAARKAEPLLAGIPIRRGIVCQSRQATFATLACDAYRPLVDAPVGNLFLAGDWTATGWPATIESAVRSGRAAARAVIDLGRAARGS